MRLSADELTRQIREAKRDPKFIKALERFCELSVGIYRSK